MVKTRRFVIMFVFICLAAAYTTYLTQARERENVPQHESLDKFPDQLGDWHKADTQTLDNRVLDLLAPDDYLSRTYVNSKGQPVYLFIAYYLSQRSGKTLHSPQNCLPGAGWEIVQQRRINTPANDLINEFTIAKQQTRMITYYWYQGRGRLEASEYWDKIFGVRDAILKNRTDAALVRVIVASNQNADVEATARQTALDFIRQMRNDLPRFIPN